MEHHLIITLAALGLLGSLAQWFAWWVKLPAILFLLLIGIVVGPVTGVFNPDEVFGDLLFPIVSLSVSVILFEGGLTLNFKELRGIESVVLNLVSFGLLVTWVIIAVATHYLMGFEWALSALFGALVVVTGPTVIVPMLRSVRPTEHISNILRWEGIVIDPIGALLAVLVFSFIISGHHEQGGATAVLLEFAETIVIGLALGALFGYLLGIVLRRHWMPEYLHSVATLTFVFTVFVAANSIREESGLLAVTVMGVWLANMRKVPIDEILSFKESLSILLISGLFIILAARLDQTQFLSMGWGAIGVFLVIQFIARPVKVLLSTLGSSLDWRERGLLAWIAPRGIVAAAVSALFSIKLEAAGYSQAPLMVSLTFMVIIGTVVLQSATARPLAKLLKVAEPEPHGVLIIGANPVARAIATALKKEQFRTLLTDSHWPNIRAASLEGLEAFWGNAISERADRKLDLVGIGKLFALSQNDLLNTLAVQKYAGEFGHHQVFSLPPNVDESQRDRKVASDAHRGQLLFGETITYSRLASWLANGAEIKVTGLTDEFTFEDYLEKHAGRVVPLFVITEGGNLRPFGDPDHPPKATPGSRIISLIKPTPEQAS